MINITEKGIAYSKNIARGRGAMVFAVSLFIIAGVFWWLKLVGVTMSGEAFCGFYEHTHNGECEVSTLVCTLSEGDEHSHTDECYAVECSLGLEEHIHTADCYSDNAADVETAAQREATLSGVTLTGNYGRDLPAVAATQLGYTESTRNFSVGEDMVRRGYTRYGDWYGNPYGDWSAMFVSFCLNYAGIPAEYAPYCSGEETMRLEWEGKGIYTADDKYTFEAGDIVFLDRDGNGAADNVGIITSAVGDALTFIAGNYEDSVQSITYSRQNTEIMGFGSLKMIIEASATERDLMRVENAKSHIAALPDEDIVLSEMEGLDSESEEFLEWYSALRLKVTTAYVYYEDLNENLRRLVGDTSKLDNLGWTWQAQVYANTTVSSIVVYQANKYSNALTTVAYGGTVESVMGSSLDFAWWTAVVIDKNDTGYYVSAVHSTGGVSKLDVAPETVDGFVLLVWHGSEDISALSSVTEGLSVQINPENFYKSTVASATAVGTLTFMTLPAGSTSNEDINRDNLTVVPSADTFELIEINLYNYGSNINELYESDHEYPGFQQDGGTTSISSLSRFGMNFGNNITEDIATKIGDVTTNDPGAINKTVNTANSPVSGAMYSTLVNGYPAMANGTSLYYLFSESTYASKQNTDNINGLFKYNSETGAYTFNSRENHAQFEAETNTFVLYDQIITSNFIMYPFGNFLPLNDILTQTTRTTTVDKTWFQETASNALMKYNIGSGDIYLSLYNSLNTYVSLMDSAYGTGAWDYSDAINKYFSLNSIEFTQTDSYLDGVYSIDYDEATNFFFGMDMHMDFIQPVGGLTGLDGKQEMVFEFTGDDDVWIYVDGTLFLDLTGIHRHVGGKIDFVNGTVEYYDLDPATGDVTSEPTNTVTFAEILGTDDGLNENGAFEDLTAHTLDFYYMERGAGSGVCRMNFNLPVVKKNSIAITKEFTCDEEMLGDPEFCFLVCRSDESGLLVGAGSEYEVYDEHGNLIRSEVTDENGFVRIKAGETAVIADIPDDSGSYFVRELLPDEVFEQYDTVSVDGSSITKDTYTDVVLGSDSFMGVDSSVKDMSNGSTHFTFNNCVDDAMLASVEIKKEAIEYTDLSSEKTFELEVSLDSLPIPAGTVYYLKDTDGTTKQMTLSEDGVITLSSGQSARFENVLAGSILTVSESDSSQEGYTVTYIGENIELSEIENGASATVKAGSQAIVTVYNDREGIKLTIPANKSVLYWDGYERSYTFTLREIVSLSDTSEVEGGKYLRSTVTITSCEEEFFFKLNYPPDTTEYGTYYYLISEDGAQPSNGMDTAFYIVEVSVTDGDGILQAQIVRIMKNGTEPTETVSFENRTVRSLTVTKTVQNTNDVSGRFAFDITAAVSGIPLSGTYSCTAPNGQTQIVFEEGTATVYLCDSETLTVSDLPYGTEWTVTERASDGYFTKVSVNSNDAEVTKTASGTLDENSTVAYTNIGGYELPATGSSAHFIYIFGGMSLVMFSLICGCILRRKRERRYRD